MPVFYQGPGGNVPFYVTFNSQSERSSSLGHRWTHSFNYRIIDDSPYGATLIDPDGRETYFTYSAGEYLAPPGSKYKLWWFAGVYSTVRVAPCGCGHNGEEHTYYEVGPGIWAPERISRRAGAGGAKLTWQLSYDANGNLTAVTDPNGRQTTFIYTTGYLTRVTVPGGLHADFAYDTYTPKRLIRITDAAGQGYQFAYTGTRVNSITDPTGRQVWYQYGTFNGKAAIVAHGITGSPQSTVTYSYAVQPNGQLYTDITEQKDGQNRIIRNIWEFTDDVANGRYYGTLLQAIKDWGDSGRVNASLTWAYDSQLRRLGVRDSYQPEPGGKDHVHRFYYQDPLHPNAITKLIDAQNYDPTLGSASPSYQFQYDAYGFPTQVSTPEGRVTNLTYVPGTDRVTSIIVQDEDINGNPVQRTTSFAYWDASKAYQLRTVMDACGNMTTFYYDANCYLDYIEPPLGSNIDVTANSVGDIVSITDGNGNTTSFGWDGIHRLTQVTYPDIGAGQKSISLTWNCWHLLDQVTDENGVVTKLEYDPYGKWLRKVTEDFGGLNYVTEYTYDEVGNPKTVKNARLKTTTYMWDGADRLIRVDYPDATYETWTLKDDGRIASHRDGRGRVTYFRYDANDQLWGPYGSGYKAIDYPTMTDVYISRDKDGLITGLRDAMGTTSVVYYPSQWVKSLTNGAGKTVTYQYNGVGNVTTLTTPDNVDLTYTYNARNQLASVTNPNGVTITFTYDNGGRRTRITRPGSYIRYDYNARNWLTSVRNLTTGGTTRYRADYAYSDGGLWDHTGNPLRRSEYWAGTSAYLTTLRYDRVYRLTEETRRNPSGTIDYSVTYGYDAVGNRTSMTRDGTAYTYSHDHNDKLTSISGGGQSASFAYDGAGNMTSVSGSLFGSWSLAYDDESRLTSVTYPSGGGSVTDLYYYNALGQRMRARLGGTWWRYVYDGERVLEETNDSGGPLARHTAVSGSYYGPWLHTQRAGGISRFPLYDAVGTARHLVDASAAITDSYTLDAFGRQLSASGTTQNAYRFGAAWGYLTGPSGLLQLGARVYWPELGRFVQQDPLRVRWNRYAHARSNPVTRVDPPGLADIFVGFEGEASGVYGLDLGLGVVFDTDHPLESGVYATTGPAVGPNVGAAVTAGFARRDIEGYSYNVDVNVKEGSGAISFDACGWNAVAVGVGPGAGLSTSFTTTSTYTAADALSDLREVYRDLRALYRDLRDIAWWLAGSYRH